MAWRRPWLAIVCLCVSLVSCNIVPSVIRTDHQYILVRTVEDRLVVLEDDDPLFGRFDAEVLDDPYLARLLSIFENTTESFLATNALTSLSQTISNHLIIVLDSADVGVLHRVKVYAGGEAVPIELALGVGREGQVDLAFVRQNLARAMGMLLLELAGLKPKPGDLATEPAIYEPTTPERAFWVGFGAALEAFYGEQHLDLLRLLYQDSSPEVRDRLSRYEAIPRNGLRYRFANGTPTAELHPPEEAMRTPGVVATFFYRLLRQDEGFYPQRYLLWFNSYEPEEIPYGKVLLAANRLSGKDLSVQAFIAGYVEAFPSEKEAVLTLAEQAFGQGVSKK